MRAVYLTRPPLAARYDDINQHGNLTMDRQENQFDRYTDRARETMRLASDEARRLNHEYVETEHVLLGLVREGTGVGANILLCLGVKLDRVREQIEKLVKRGAEPVTVDPLPRTPRVTRMLERAAAEARKLGHNYVGTEHLLLGLISEQDGIAAQVLTALGLSLEQIRNETINLLGGLLPEEAMATTDQEIVKLAAMMSSPPAAMQSPEMATLMGQSIDGIFSSFIAMMNQPSPGIVEVEVVTRTVSFLLNLLSTPGSAMQSTLEARGVDVSALRAELEKYLSDLK
jgi:hypothetical protein